MINRGINLIRVRDFLVGNKSSEGIQSARIAIYELDCDPQTIELVKFLSDDEYNFFTRIKNHTAKNSYLCGRYVAKNALLDLTKTYDPKTFSIGNGIFGQPVVSVAQFSNLQVSISHSSKYFAALAFFEECPMAIDVEEMNSERNSSAITQMTNYEIYEIIPKIDIINPALLLWTAKEALSKVLRTGLHVDFKVFEVDRIYYQNGNFVGNFKNFSQYKFTSYSNQNLILTTVIPEKTDLLGCGIVELIS